MPTLTIDVSGMDAAAGAVQAYRNGIADRGQLHAELAVTATQFTRDYMAGTPRHNTAQRLGATPTNFRARSARALEAAHDDAGAIIRIPRSTGLARAWSNITIRPGSGRKYLTIPAVARTYGKVVRDFPPGTFAFTIIGGRYPALVFVEDWSVAYWLRTEVTQRQDRTLLPSDEAYQELGRRVIIAHYQRAVSDASGPYGGTSTGMPSA